MGCCFSSPQGPHSPYPGDPNTASARAINPQPSSPQQQPQSQQPDPPPIDTSQAATAVSSHPATLTSSAPSPPVNAIPVQSRRRSRRENQPLSQHINKPLRRHVWRSAPAPADPDAAGSSPWSPSSARRAGSRRYPVREATPRIWTRAALDRERTDFFDTRVAGRPEVWQALHAVLQILWDPEGQGAADDGTDGVATAQGLLDAAEVTLPTGDLAQGAYDSLGNYYHLPEWVVSDPEDVAGGSGSGSGEGDGRGAGTEDDDSLSGSGDGSSGRKRTSATADDKGGLIVGEDSAEDAELDDEEASRRRDEKGKSAVDVRDLVTVQARLSENSEDVTVDAGKGDTIRSLARKVQDESGLPPTKKIRIAYMGKILKENSSLADQGWTQGHVVNALVFDR